MPLTLLFFIVTLVDRRLFRLHIPDGGIAYPEKMGLDILRCQPVSIIIILRDRSDRRSFTDGDEN